MCIIKRRSYKKAEEFQNKLGRASQVYIGTSDYEWSAGVIEDGDDTVKLMIKRAS